MIKAWSHFALTLRITAMLGHWGSSTFITSNINFSRKVVRNCHSSIIIIACLDTFFLNSFLHNLLESYTKLYRLIITPWYLSLVMVLAGNTAHGLYWSSFPSYYPKSFVHETHFQLLAARRASFYSSVPGYPNINPTTLLIYLKT